jgi:ribosomal-protein-alanine N-acetyltransferase
MNTSGNLFKLNSSDLEFSLVAKLDAEQFPFPWSLEGWSTINWSCHSLYGFKLGETLAGYALFSMISGSDSAHLLKICVDKSFRGNGISAVFWAKCLSEIKCLGFLSVYLEVEKNNLQAIRFYEKMNFKSLRQIKGYYSNGADAVTMLLTL